MNTNSHIHILSKRLKQYIFIIIYCIPYRNMRKKPTESKGDKPEPKTKAAPEKQKADPRREALSEMLDLIQELGGARVRTRVQEIRKKL